MYIGFTAGATCSFKLVLSEVHSLVRVFPSFCKEQVLRPRSEMNCTGGIYDVGLYERLDSMLEPHWSAKGF